VINIVRHEGLSALWRGTAPALAMSVPGQVIYMVGYDWGRRTAYANAPSWARTGSSTPMTTTDGLKPSYQTAVPLVAGALSRTVVAALTSPLELVRTRLQAQSAASSTSIGAIIASIRADPAGWTSAWRGLPVTLWRDVPFSGIYWAGYEAIKRGLTGGKGMGEGWEGQGAGREFTVAFISGAGSGMVSFGRDTLMNYPSGTDELNGADNLLFSRPAPRCPHCIEI
jgi:solute carrier family 25 protein 39/40